MLKQGLWASRIPIEASMRAPSRRFDLPRGGRMEKENVRLRYHVIRLLLLLLQRGRKLRIDQARGA